MVDLTTKQLRIYAYPVAIIIVISLVIYYVFFTNVRPSIDDIWVINLDKDKDKLQHVMKQQDKFPVKINRWVGTYGKDEDRTNADKDGVHFMLSRSDNAEENNKSNKILSKPGEIGCWLSHKRLLRNLYKMNVPPNYGHLILEDDAVVQTDFNKKWNNIRKSIPTDWDIVYLGINKMVGDRLNEHVFRWRNDKSSGNWGCHGYLVRHRSLKHILEKLRFMTAPIDVQFYNMLGDLNIYIVNPPLITVNAELESSIDKQQKRVM
jgi:glycosyl transferase family 25